MSSKILFFSAPWCGPCKLVKKALTDEVRERLNIIEIDVSKSPEKSAEHQILGVPTLVPGISCITYTIDCLSVCFNFS